MKEQQCIIEFNSYLGKVYLRSILLENREDGSNAKATITEKKENALRFYSKHFAKIIAKNKMFNEPQINGFKIKRIKANG